MLRKLFFTGLLIFVAPGSPSQIVIAMLVTLFLTYLSAFLEPYISDSDDVMAILANLEVFMILFAGLLIKVQCGAAPRPRRTAPHCAAPTHPRLAPPTFVLCPCLRI